VQQQVAVDSLHIAELRRVTRRAPDRLKHHVSPRGRRAAVRRSLYRRRQPDQKTRKQFTLLLTHVELQCGRVKVLRRGEAHLVMAGHLEAQLVGTSRPDEIAESRNLAFP